MSLLDLFLKDAQGPLDLSTAPTDSHTAHIRQRAQELYHATERLQRAEELVAAIKERKKALESKLLPSLMDEAQTDTIGLPEANVDIVVQPYVHAAIKQDWPPEQRAAAFAHLDEIGGGDLPQATVVVKFPKEDMHRAQKLQNAINTYLQKLYANKPTPPVSLDLAVHHGTLTSWLKEELATRQEKQATGYILKPLKLDLLGATVGRICKIKKRTEKKIRGKRR